ncbi:MAG: Glycosyltransferase [Candidatus Roizmanbacteria bacterium GW2011_GWA2_35_19]|uniref:Glycosyltransferase n=2 Tax=Candidatus Roizmaniibacteriota TaxID=1752723 RepID=A0A0G0C6I2_9BACT|nr:MAG: Glycosyltransferase [Candidatus Roizmanbacteria bacterium GW2011_GWC2_35_12]KKP71746.1 MAG: Glycosyltransferase [Candidatus Roizmanbacteria bacterium GW2011_GWA2_35_19]
MDPMQPFFSIVIPTLNEEKFLPKLLKDLEKQKRSNFEIIVVDSMSEDDTRKVAEKFPSLPLSFIENERKNVSYQRNYGANKARGAYLIFLDADSRISSGFTKKLENIINKKKGLFFVPAMKTDNPNTEPQFIVDIVNLAFQISQNIGRPFVLGAGIIIEKKYFFTIGGFDEKLSFGEDYDLAIRSFNWGVRAKFLNEIKFTYSLRRIRREGKLKAYYTFFLSTLQYIFNGKTEKKLFNYDMGGHLYDKKQVKIKEKNLLDSFDSKNILQKIRRIFSELFIEE